MKISASTSNVRATLPAPNLTYKAFTSESSSNFACMGPFQLYLDDRNDEGVFAELRPDAIVKLARCRVRIEHRHRDLALGVATYARELFDAAGPLDAVYVPVGLGSGIVGLMTMRDLMGLDTEIIGVVSELAPATALSFAAGSPCTGRHTLRTSPLLVENRTSALIRFPHKLTSKLTPFIFNSYGN